MKKFALDNVLKIVALDNELELMRANSLQLKLRVLAKENPELIQHRKHLRSLISDYEKRNWSEDVDEIDDKQVLLNDIAEEIVEKENAFIITRKNLIRIELKKRKLNQQNLALLLGHTKSYMSELINGVRPFSMPDIVAIHLLLGIKIDYLLPPFLNSDRRAILNKNVKKLQKENPKLRIDKKDLQLELTD